MRKILPLTILLVCASAYAQENVVGVFLPDIDTLNNLPKPATLEIAELRRGFFVDESPYFYLFSDMPMVVNKIKNVTAASESAMTEYFGKTDKFIRPIVVNIVDSKDTSFEGQFAVDVKSTSDIIIALRWNADLELDILSRLLSGAILRKLAMEKSGSEESLKNIPFWLECGFANVIRQKAETSIISKYARDASKDRPLALEKVFNFTRENVDYERCASHSFWALHSLNKIFKNKNEFNSFMRKVCLDANNAKDLDLLYKIFANGEKENFKIFYNCVLAYEIASRLGGVQSMESSAQEILRLCFVSADMESEGFADNAVFENRKILEKALRLKVLEIKAFLPRVNPLFYNATLSLGSMFEASLDDDSKAFQKHRDSFIKEFKEAKELSEVVEKLLNQE